MKHIRNWHYMVMPKYDFDYFLDRCNKFGAQNIIKVIIFIQAYMGKVRKVKTGDLTWDDIN